MEILRTKTLTKVRDGQLAEMIDEKFAEAFQDCIERPLLKKSRTITLQVEISPTGQDDPLDEVDVDFKVKSTIPAQAFGRRMKSVSKSKGFGFSADTDSTNESPGQQNYYGDDED